MCPAPPGRAENRQDCNLPGQSSDIPRKDNILHVQMETKGDTSRIESILGTSRTSIPAHTWFTEIKKHKTSFCFLAFFLFFACLAGQQNRDIRCDWRMAAESGSKDVIRPWRNVQFEWGYSWSSVSSTHITLILLPTKHPLLSSDVSLFPFHHTQLQKSRLAECKTTLVSRIWTWYGWILTEEQSRTIDAFRWIIPL